jgi:hypothetical protein
MLEEVNYFSLALSHKVIEIVSLDLKKEKLRILYYSLRLPVYLLFGFLLREVFINIRYSTIIVCYNKL